MITMPRRTVINWDGIDKSEMFRFFHIQTWKRIRPIKAQIDAREPDYDSYGWDGKKFPLWLFPRPEWLLIDWSIPKWMFCED